MSTGWPFDALRYEPTVGLLQSISFVPEGEVEPPPAFSAPEVNPGEAQGAYVSRCVAANPGVANASAQCTQAWLDAQEPEPPPREELHFPPGEYVGQVRGSHGQWTWVGDKWAASFNWRRRSQE